MNLLVKVTFGVTVAELEGLPGAFAVRRQQIIRQNRRHWRMQGKVDITIFQPAATFGGHRAVALSLGLRCCQEPPQTVGMLAQLHSVDSQTAGL